MLFAALLGASWLFAFYLLPETRGRPFEGGDHEALPPPHHHHPPHGTPPHPLLGGGGGEGKGGTELQPLRGGEDG